MLKFRYDSLKKFFGRACTLASTGYRLQSSGRSGVSHGVSGGFRWSPRLRRLPFRSRPAGCSAPIFRRNSCGACRGCPFTIKANEGYHQDARKSNLSLTNTGFLSFGGLFCKKLYLVNLLRLKNIQPYTKFL